jgi:hypothetical protein
MDCRIKSGNDGWDAISRWKMIQLYRKMLWSPHGPNPEGRAEGEVRRMLDPRHATKIGRLEEALATLGKRLVVEVAPV